VFHYFFTPEFQFLIFCKVNIFIIIPNNICAKARFGSLTFAKRWLVCRAKGNVPNVGRFSAFLSCGSAKKLNLLSFQSVTFFISYFVVKFNSLCQVCSMLSFFRLVANVSSSKNQLFVLIFD